MRTTSIISATMLLGLVFAVQSALANSGLGCPSYEDITNGLQKQFGEQKVFRGFLDGPDQGAATILEFWGNAEQGSWSLLMQRLTGYRMGRQHVSDICTRIIATGIRYYEVAQGDQAPAFQATTSDALATPNCLPREVFVQSLLQRQAESPLLRALANDTMVVEIFAGERSWTLARGKIKSAFNPRTGNTAHDPETGRERHQLCTLPAFSGTHWGLFNDYQVGI